MSVSMPSPWKHPTTGTFYLKQRVPADLCGKARGVTLDITVAGTPWPVKVGDQVKVSLRTKEAGPAKVRHREADESLQLHWARLRSDEVELTHRQLLEIAGAIYRDLIQTFDQEPGTPEQWQEGIRVCAEAGAMDPPRDLPDTVPDEFDTTALEILIRETTGRVLGNRGIRVTERSRLALRVETIAALAQAFHDNMRKAEGDYSPSAVALRFPLPSSQATPRPAAGNGVTITDLFDHWKRAQKQQGKSESTALRWRSVVASIIAFLGHEDAASVSDDDIMRWRQAVVESGQSTPLTFNRNHLAAIRSLYRQENGRVAKCADPTLGLKWRVAEPAQQRPKGFTAEEALAILRAADQALAAEGKTSDVMRWVQRWVPWLCAYTGARVGEIAQLRGADVLSIDGVDCIRITPEAGTTKTRKFRDVPLHPHLIELGFLDWAKKRGSGPLFYAPTMKSKTPWSISGNKLAAWVRATAKVTDPRVKPNHGWRHAFKTAGRQVGIDRLYLNGICGQSLGTTEGDKYGDLPMSAVLREIERLPRWDVHDKAATTKAS